MAEFATTGTAGATTSAQGITVTGGPGIIPSIWNGALLKNYYEISAVPLITRRATLKNGNKLIFSLAGGVSVTKTKTSDPQNASVNYESAKITQKEIEMDTLYNWGLEFNDITLLQTNLDLLEGEMIEASESMDEEISLDVYADIFASAGLTLGNITVSALNAYDYIVDLATQLNKNKIPKKGRYAVIDYDYLGLLSKDPRFTFQPTVLENGIIEGQKISGMQIIATTQLPQLKGGATGIFAIQNQAYGYDMQMDKVQHIDKLQDSWNEIVRGRALTGYGVIRENSICGAAATYDLTIQPNIGFEPTEA